MPIMTSHGQFCSIARALDVLGQRWMLLVVRELLMGSRRFGEIRRGLPRISRTMLSARLRELVDTGIASRGEDAAGPFYELTSEGRNTTRAMETAWRMYEQLGFRRSPDLDFRQGNLEVFGFELYGANLQTDVVEPPAV
jgi:DNA-binding HxlR family transcriptional regulator